MEFVDDEHEKFWNEKNLIMQEYGKTDVYYKSIVYTLGICETTRNNFNKIFSIENGEINIDSINSAFQTGTSEKVTRMAFSLWNRCNYDSDKDRQKGKVSKYYNPSEIFCCSYAPYFVEALKIRYPEYFRSKEEQEKYIASIYTRVGNIEQLDYYIDKKIENKEDNNIVALYMRTNLINANEVNSDIYSQRDKLENYCKKHNIVNRIYYIDVRKSGMTDDRKALNELIEDLKIGKVKKIIVTDISKLYRDTIKLMPLFSNDYMKNVDIVSLNGESINKETFNALFEKVKQDITKFTQGEKRKKIAQSKKKIKNKDSESR